MELLLNPCGYQLLSEPSHSYNTNGDDMALADNLIPGQLQFRPSPNVAAGVLHSWGPSPVMTAFGPLPVKSPQEIFNSTEDATTKSPIEVTRTTIGERIERMLATLAFHSDPASPLLIAERNQFTPSVIRDVLQRLQIQPSSSVLASLAEDLRATLANAPMRRDWGDLRLEGERIVLHPAPAAPAALPSRPVAKVVGRTLIE